MNKNVRVGVLASLLVAPGIVAHANEATPVVGIELQQVPFKTFAAVDTKADAIKVFTELSIVSTNAKLTSANESLAFYKAQTGDQTFTAEELAVIEAKLGYIEAIKGTKGISQNVITYHTQLEGLSTTKASYLADVANAVATHKAIGENLEKAQKALGNLEIDNVSIAGTLEYTDVNTGDKDALKAFITDIMTKNQKTDNQNKLGVHEVNYNEAMDFINNSAMPIHTNVDPSANVAGFKTNINAANTAFAGLSPDMQAILKKSLVPALTLTAETILKTAQTDIKNAETVDVKIKALVTGKDLSPAQFNSRLTEIDKAIKALSERGQKLLVEKGQYEPLAQAKVMIDKIAALKPAGTEAFRVDSAALYAEFKSIESVTVQSNIINSDILVGYIETIEKTLGLIEEAINEIGSKASAADRTAAIQGARKSYNALNTAQKRMFLADSLNKLKEWEGTSKSAVAVDKLITAVVVSKTDFPTKTALAIIGYTKLGDSKDQTVKTDEQKMVTGADRLLALQPYATITKRVYDLKTTLSSYATDLVSARTEYGTWVTAYSANLTEKDVTELTALNTALDKLLKSYEEEKGAAEAVDTSITALKASGDKLDLVELAKTRTAYMALSPNGKKLVTSLKDLTALEKQYKAALGVVTLIGNLDFAAKDFAKKVQAAEKAYTNISPKALQTSVSNYSVLEELTPIAQLMLDIDALKSTSADFRAKVEATRKSYTTIIGTVAVVEKPENIKQRVAKEYEPKIVVAEKILKAADDIVAAISRLKTLSGQQFMDALSKASVDYKNAPADVKRNVTNAKDLTALEKDYKASLTVFKLVETLPPLKDKSYVKKVDAAEKAYQKLNETQRGYVYNYQTKLAGVLKVAQLIGRIDALKITSKTYEVDVKSIREDYITLSDANKALVYNYSSLEAAESNMSTADGVMQLINAAKPGVESYIAKLMDARNAYDGLDKAQQKLVLNYKDLTTREKSVKPILLVDSQITLLNPSNATTFISKYKAAEKIYEKMTLSERGLLTNTQLFLTELKPLYEVISSIAAIKNSSKTFVADTQQARLKFTALTPDQQARISNYSVLTGHELNVEGGAKVDAMIQAIKASDPKEYLQKVKEARMAYDALNSTNKKAVALADVLKQEERYVKPVETTINLIEGLSNPRNDLSKQFDKVNAAMKKLNNEQLSFVTNIDKFSDLSNVIYVYQLIEKLKPSDKYYLGNLQSAKLGYERLASDDKQRVTNYYKLQSAEQDVSEIEKVITQISSLSSSSSTYATDIANAQASYKALPSGSRKQVANYDQLIQADKNLKEAEKVMKTIAEIDSALRNFESKVKAAQTAYDKLTATQQSLVANYNLLRSYTFELGL